MLLQIAKFHFLLLSSIPLYVSMCVYIYICHFFFIHSSVDGHLPCFHILAIVHNAAMKASSNVYQTLLTLWLNPPLASYNTE